MNIKNRLGTTYHQSSSNAVHNRLGNQNSKLKNRISQGKGKDLIVTTGDIRNKLIARKRNSISDARERLSQIARQGDARNKLNNMKFPKNSQTPMAVRLPKFQTKNENAFEVKKTIVNKARKAVNITEAAKASGLTGKTLLYEGTLFRTVKSNKKIIPKQVNVNTRTRLQFVQQNSDRYHPLKNNHNVVTIKNERAKLMQQNMQQTIIDRSMRRQQRPNKMNAPLPPPPPMYIERPPVYDVQMQNAVYETPSYQSAWEQPQQQMPMNNMQIGSTVRPTQLRITTDNDYMRPYRPINKGFNDDEAIYDNYVPSRPAPYKRSAIDHFEDEYMPTPFKKQAILSSDIVSRLDEQNVSMRPGYKVIVTNLHHVVTLEDVEELFGNIGLIKNAKIVREGVAEIVFVNEMDAQKSVETYHNRQLDGRAMNVLVVQNKQNAIPNTSSHRQRFSPPIDHRRPMIKSNFRETGNGLSQARQPIHKRPRQNDISTDIYAIKQALFSANNALVAANRQFRVASKFK